IRHERQRRRIRGHRRHCGGTARQRGRTRDRARHRRRARRRTGRQCVREEGFEV
ncbi:hypothetical protein LTR66_016024, partial [Elasticomyces elasticus]